MSQVVALLPEGRLTLVADNGVVPLIEPWIPLGVSRTPESTRPAGDILVRSRAHTAVSSRLSLHDEDTRPPLLRLGSARAVRQPDGSIALFGQSGTRGQLNLDTRRAVIEIAHEGGADEAIAAGDAYSMLTITAALVLGLNGMALAHAGAVGDRSGGAWIVVGDSHAGKTSTCTALVQTGWSFLADDQIILAAEDRGVRVWGWPRRAHLDGGWSRGEVTGVRDVVNLVEQWPTQVVTSAPLAGVLLPQVMADARTETHAVHAADALAALIRQSPWLISDPAVASRVLPVLEATASARAFHLVLGRDSYARGDVLESRILNR